MAAIDTSKKLVGKTITLLDGTVSKITDAIASGYKVEGLTKRIATRCVVKSGKGFAEIERRPLGELEVLEGYVAVKADAPKGKAAAKGKAPKGKAAAPASEEAGRKVRRKKSEPVEDFVEEKLTGKVVNLTQVDQELADDLTSRMMDYLRRGAKKMPNGDDIGNDIEVKFGTEFSESGIQMTFNVNYALAKPESNAVVGEEVLALAKKKIGKTYGKKLAAAIKEAFGLTKDEFVPGTVMVKGDDEVAVCGPSIKDADKLLVYVFGTDGEEGKFRLIAATGLKNYEILYSEDEEEEEVEDEEEDLEEEEEVEEDGDDEPEDDGDDESEGDEPLIVSLDEDDFESINKKKSAAFFKKLAKALEVEGVVPGTVVTDGEMNYALVGITNDGNLYVKDADELDEGLMQFDEDDIDDVFEMSLVLGEETDGDDDEGEEDGEDDSDFDDEDEDGEDEEDGEDLDDDFESTDVTDMDDDELRSYVVEQELTTAKRAAKLNRAKLLALVA